jgi:hypothetical protein
MGMLLVALLGQLDLVVVADLLSHWEPDPVQLLTIG